MLLFLMACTPTCEDGQVNDPITGDCVNTWSDPTTPEEALADGKTQAEINAYQAGYEAGRAAERAAQEQAQGPSGREQDRSGREQGLSGREQDRAIELLAADKFEPQQRSGALCNQVDR